MPLSRESGTRLTFPTAEKASGSACQMKASALKSGFRGGSGASRSSARAIRSIRPPIGSWKFMALSFKALAARCKAEAGRYSRATFVHQSAQNGR
jgi:hypothetical protein